MKFAFSTIGCPKWDFQVLLARAKEYGYDGVEIRGFLSETCLTAANVFAGEPAKLRELFAAGGVSIACLSSAIAMSGSAGTDQQSAGDLLKYVETAASLGCPMVRISGPRAQSGRSLTEVASSFARWLAPLVDSAADRGVTIAIENSAPFRRAREIWMAMEMLNHPAITASLDVFSAALAGEGPAVSVPVLNSRLSYVTVRDAVINGTSAGICRLGEGNVRLLDLFNRLRGVGYKGWVSVDWPKASLAGLAEPEQVLPEAIAKLKQWTTPKVVVKPARPEAKKPAAPAEPKKVVQPPAAATQPA
jgi:fatty-acyl-CoA synthase